MLGTDLYVGLSHMGENVQLKTQTESGNIIKYTFDGAELVSNNVAESFGAVLDLTVCRERKILFAGINSKVVCLDSDLNRLFETSNQIMVYKVKAHPVKQEVIVCDVMKSLTVYSYDSQKFEVRVRYPNG